MVAANPSWEMEGAMFTTDNDDRSAKPDGRLGDRKTATITAFILLDTIWIAFEGGTMYLSADTLHLIVNIQVVRAIHWRCRRFTFWWKKNYIDANI